MFIQTIQKAGMRPFLPILCILIMLRSNLSSQVNLEVDNTSFAGILHDNVSNQHRQGSGLNPLVHQSNSKWNLFRDDAVGWNFEHIFNGAKAQHSLSMFTPRKDECRLSQLEKDRYELRWPAEQSQWGMESAMIYDFSKANQVDLHFECKPTIDLFPQGYFAMMWASYMQNALDRRMHFWGKKRKEIGWHVFGEGKGSDLEVGTLSHEAAANLPYEEGAQTLNLIENTEKHFILPFYYGILDQDLNPSTKEDQLLYLVLFDQTTSIRFAMWNFFKNEDNQPDTHSPAWDWQYVVRNPQPGMVYGYHARVVIEPFKSRDQIWTIYSKWREETGGHLPAKNSLKH